MRYEKFEDLPVWKEIRQLVKLIYHVCNHNNFKNDFSLTDQIRRASTSILLNLSEGFERKSNKDFAKFVNQAKASAGEVRCILYIALDLGYLSNEQFDLLFKEVQSISGQLSKFQRYLLETGKKISNR